MEKYAHQKLKVQLTLEEMRNPKFFVFYRKVGHAIQYCCKIRKFYHDKVQMGQIVQEQQQ